MRELNARSAAAAGEPKACTPTDTGRRWPAPVPSERSPCSTLLLQNYRCLACKHLDKPTCTLFQELTGLGLCAVWPPTWPCQWAYQHVPSASPLCRRLAAADAAARNRCHACGARHLASTLKSGEKGHRFTCLRGVRNFWVPLLVRDLCVGIAFIQTLEKNGKPCAKLARRAARSPGSGGQAGTSAPAGETATRLGRSQFDRAAKLLRLITRHVGTAILAELREADLAKTRQEMLIHAREEVRLRHELHGRLPCVRETPATAELKTHSGQLVCRMLECIHRDYAHGISLKQCAETLGRNPSYLSTLFSRTLGVPFKACLTELRLAKAKQQLSDPARRVADVAYAVGYTDANRFRAAFKAATSVAPRAWRELLRMPAET